MKSTQYLSCSSYYEVKGNIATIDAMGCQKAIAADIIEGGGDYVLALKGNQGRLSDQVKQFFTQAQANQFSEIAHEYHETVDGGHWAGGSAPLLDRDCPPRDHRSR